MAVTFQLTHGITLLKPSGETQSRSGAISDSTFERIETRAGLLSTRGSERIDGILQDSELQLRLAVRYVSGLSTAWRVEFDGREYDISAVLPVSGARRRSWLIIESKESNLVSLEPAPIGARPVYSVVTMAVPDPASGALVFDVSGDTMPAEYDTPVPGDSIAFNIPMPTDGRRLVFLMPDHWPEPSAYYVGADRSINQIGALVKVRARLIPGTVVGADDYVAWVTRHPKLTNTEVNDVFIWS